MYVLLLLREHLNFRNSDLVFSASGFNLQGISIVQKCNLTNSLDACLSSVLSICRSYLCQKHI